MTKISNWTTNWQTVLTGRSCRWWIMRVWKCSCLHKSKSLLKFASNRSTLIWLLYSAKIRLMLEIWKVSKVSSMSVSSLKVNLTSFHRSIYFEPVTIAYLSDGKGIIQNYISLLVETPQNLDSTRLHEEEFTCSLRREPARRGTHYISKIPLILLRESKGRRNKEAMNAWKNLKT